MSENSRISIVVPDSLIAVAAGKGLSAQERSRFAPSAAMARLMARGQWDALQVCEGDPLEQWLASITGVSMGPPPAWAMAGAGDVRAFSRWFVSPVHVGIGREGVSLMPPDELGLSDEHAVALNELLCGVVAEHGWTPVGTSADQSANGRHSAALSGTAAEPIDGGHRARRSQGSSQAGPQWGCVLQTDAPLPRSLPSPWALASQRFTDLLPGGADMAEWRRMWMDVQMALHSHPVNAQRQAQGLPAINAFWWWGGGEPLDRAAVRQVCLRVHDLAQMGHGNSAHAAPAPVLAASPHRCSAWLRSLLVSPDRAGQGVEAKTAAPDNSLSDQLLDPVAVHLVENANAGMWFGAGSQHPAVVALDQTLMAPLAQAAAPHELVLLGQSGWRRVASSAGLRLAFWKNRPDIDYLLEPVDGLLDEADLARAWQDSARRAVPDEGEFHPDRF